VGGNLTSDSERPIVDRRRIRSRENRITGVRTKKHTGTLSDKDPFMTLPFTVLSEIWAEEDSHVHPIGPVVTDIVSDDSSVRTAEDGDPLGPVPCNHIRTGDSVGRIHESNESE
jgi:hypothetical protein